MRKVNPFLMGLLILFSAASMASAAVTTNVKPYNVIAKMEYDRSCKDPAKLIAIITEALVENLETASGEAIRIVESNDGMEPEKPIKVLNFPPAMINGELQYGKQIEFWTDRDSEFLTAFGPRYGVATPWNISIVSSPDMMKMMMDMLREENSISETSPSPKKDYILVTMMNPMAISKTIYRDLPWMDNIAFNNHCRSVTGIVEKSVLTVLRTHTDFQWQPSSSELIYDGIAIKKGDVDAITLDMAMPQLHVSRIPAARLVVCYRKYVSCVPRMFAPGAPLENVGKMVAKLFADLFVWLDPNMPFESDLTQWGGPVIRFENLDDFKAQFPKMVNSMFLPLWQKNLVTQPWKYIRSFEEGLNREVTVFEMCSKLYASMALSTGFHHAPALPCMVGFWEEECGDPRCPVSCGSNLNMLAASAAFYWFFKDAAMMMDMMNMPVQAFMFQNMPKIINYEISAMLNGALSASGASERIPLPPWE